MSNQAGVASAVQDTMPLTRGGDRLRIDGMMAVINMLQDAAGTTLQRGIKERQKLGSGLSPYIRSLAQYGNRTLDYSPLQTTIPQSHDCS
jgi:hypothetical protein